MTIVGIDIGGTKIASALVQEDQLVSEILVSSTPQKTTEIVEVMVNHIRSLQEKAAIEKVGISTAGCVDSSLGRVIGSTGNLPKDYPIISLSMEIKQKTNLDVYVENDANAAAYAEFLYGNGQGMDTFVFIIIGTGIGGGIMIDKKLYKGAHHFAAECGHVIINYNQGRPCTCGGYGCLEAYGSGPGLLKTAQEIFQHHNLPAADLTTYKIIDLYRQQDSLALESIGVWHKHIGVGLASIANILNPEAFILGGAMANFLDYHDLDDILSQFSLDPVKVMPAKFKNNAGIIGAAALAKMFLTKSTVDI